MDCVIEPEVGGLISKNVLKCCVESNTGRARGIREKKIMTSRPSRRNLFIIVSWYTTKIGVHIGMAFRMKCA